MTELVNRQKVFFNKNITKSIEFRKRMLHCLYRTVEAYEPELYAALKADLNKSEYEAYLTEVQIVKTEIKTAYRSLERWSRPKTVLTPMTHFPAASAVYREPFGVVLILSPWNYPFQLALAPLVGAIAAGNCAVLKPSKSSPRVSALLRKMIAETFEPQFVCCAPEEASYEEILEQPYDLIFFTGSERVGKTVMEAASRHVTPVVLELGGKSPCIVDRDCDLGLAAKRLVWGKFLNAGQTCVAPDYVLVDETVKEELIRRLRNYIAIFYHFALTNPDYPRIVNRHHFDRLTKLIAEEPKKIGGLSNEESLKISPCLLTEAAFDHPVMQEEIFGPILPILSYKTPDEAIEAIKARPRPLALYLFTNDKALAERVIHEVPFGGGCINDVVMHLANHHLPFGGVGSSGMGSYHGKYSFETFTRPKGILRSKTFLDIPLRYPPFTKGKLKLVRRITK